MIHQKGGGTKNNRSSIYAYSDEEQKPASMTSASLLLYGNNSQAEDTIANYRGGEQYAPKPLQLPLRAGPEGLMYPYDPDDPDYLSIYQVGFKGCFRCGQVGHYDRAQFPLNNDLKASKLFWTELGIHKPHTKRKVRLTSSLFIEKSNRRVWHVRSHTICIVCKITIDFALKSGTYVYGTSGPTSAISFAKSKWTFH